MSEYSRELKVGATLILTFIALFVGIRFLQELPLFGGSYPMYAKFEEANGLVAGNPVRMKGVNVGTVDAVELDQQSQTVQVRFSVREGVRIPEESHAKVSGFSGLGGVRLSLIPGPRDNPSLPSGATLEPPPEGSVFERLADQAPRLANKADSVLSNTNATVASLSTQFEDPQSDLRKALSSAKKITSDLESVTDEEKENIRSLLQNLRTISQDLKAFTGENADSLDLAVRRLNRSLDRLNRGLASFEQTSATLDTITTKLNRGDGTAGRLLNDPGLYTKIDSAAANANTLLRDVQRNPGRYLDDLTLVKVF